MTTPPLLLEPAELSAILTDENVLVIDLCKQETYDNKHIPGAVHVEYASIIRTETPVGGLLPDTVTINALVQSLGITESTHIVCYDEEGGGNAARLMWTLHAFDHRNISVLNGGIFSWIKGDLALDASMPERASSDYQLALIADNVIEQAEILTKLDSDDFALLDARSPGEFSGETKYSARGGRIPGAKLLEWTDMMDRNNSLRLKPVDELQAMLDERGISKDQEVTVYCQTHHRSALSYLALLHLGYPRVRGYHGAWSDWGNTPDIPLETG